jgi:hypothetical protein
VLYPRCVTHMLCKGSANSWSLTLRLLLLLLL